LEPDDHPEEVEPEEVEPEEEQQAEEEPQAPKEEPVVHSQEELDRIIESRLARERAKFEKQLNELRSEQQKDLTVKQQQTQDNAYLKKIYDQEHQLNTELGLSEQQSQTKAQKEVEREARHMTNERRQLQAEQKQAEFEKRANYAESKVSFIADTPYIAKYIPEIDDFSNKGALVDFETAMYYVIGKKVKSGELGTDMRTAGEQNALKNVNTRAKKQVNSGTSGGSADDHSPRLSNSELKYAKLFGVSPADYAKAKK
jgi:hypothetical protein